MATAEPVRVVANPMNAELSSSSSEDEEQQAAGSNTARPSLDITVRELARDSYYLVRVQPEASVGELKRRLAALTGVVPARQSLVVSVVDGGDGEPLDDDATALGDCAGLQGAGDGGVVQLTTLHAVTVATRHAKEIWGAEAQKAASALSLIHI